MAALVLASTSGSNVCAMNEAVQEASLSELMPVKKTTKKTSKKKTTTKKTTAKKTTSSSTATSSAAASAPTTSTSTSATTNSGYSAGSVVAGVLGGLLGGGTTTGSSSTGSSIMPQKKNPDIAELVRGKTGRVFGDQTSLLTTMKAIPLAYDKDMQEDKEPVFDAFDTVTMCVRLMAGMLETMTFREDVMEKSARHGFTNATDAADYLVGKGVPFRDAHGITGRMGLY